MSVVKKDQMQNNKYCILLRYDCVVLLYIQYQNRVLRHISVIICISVEYLTNIQFPVTSSAKYSRSIPGVSFDFLRLSGKLGSF